MWSRIVQQGAWVRCLVCQSRANRRAIEEAILRGKDPPPELWFERQISRGEMLQLGGKLSDGTVGEGFRGVCTKLHYPFPGCLEFVPVFLIGNVCLNKKCTACGGVLEMHRHRKSLGKTKRNVRRSVMIVSASRVATVSRATRAEAMGRT